MRTLKFKKSILNILNQRKVIMGLLILAIITFGTNCAGDNSTDANNSCSEDERCYEYTEGGQVYYYSRDPENPCPCAED
jgi:hypothetical protein